MSAFTDFLSALDTKFESSSFVTDTDNIMFNESRDLMSLGDDAYPRLETLIVKAKAGAYASQRMLNWSLRYATAGYIKRDSDDVVDSDVTNIVNFGVETFNLNMQMLDDKQSGSITLPNFTMFGEFSEIFFDFELIPKYSTFIYFGEAQFQISDTEVL